MSGPSALTGAEWQAFRRANPGGSEGWNAVYNSPAAQRARLQRDGKQPGGLTYIASDELNKAMDDYWAARGTSSEIGDVGANIYRAQMYQNWNERLKSGGRQEDFIRELRDATQKIQKDNEVADQSYALSVKNTFDGRLAEWNRLQEHKRTGEPSRYKLPYMTPEEASEANRLANVRNAQAHERLRLGGVRSAWGSALYADPNKDVGYLSQLARYQQELAAAGNV